MPRPVDLPVDLIVCHGIVVTMDQQRRVLADGAIAVSDGRIVAVDDAASVLAAYSAAEQIKSSLKNPTTSAIMGQLPNR